MHLKKLGNSYIQFLKNGWQRNYANYDRIVVLVEGKDMTQFDASQVVIAKQLDTRGLRCPEPVMMLHQAVRRAQSAEVIEVFATDPSTSWDIPKFCMHLGHTLLVQEERETDGKKEYYYQVKKK